MTEDYLNGWKEAREVWQRTGSVAPYPPGYYESDLYDAPEPEPAAAATEVSESSEEDD